MSTTQLLVRWTRRFVVALAWSAMIAYAALSDASPDPVAASTDTRAPASESAITAVALP